MAVTATITRFTGAGVEPFVVGVTRHTFSAMTSTGAAAGDFWQKIARCEWSFPDGTTAVGGVVQWCPANNTAGNVTLTVYDGLGNSAQATYAVTPTLPSFSFDQWCSSSGNDSNPPNDGSQAKPWLTVNKAFNQWINGLPQSFGRIRAPATDTPTLTGSFPTNPHYGPVYVTKGSGGGNVVAQVSDNAEIGLSTSDGEGSELAHPCIFNFFSLSYAVPQDSGAGSHTGKCDAFHSLTAFVNSVLHNAKMDCLASGFVAFNSTVEYSADVGWGFASGSSYSVLDSCSGVGNGTDSGLDHQCYVSGGSDNGFINCTFDGTGAVGAFSGIKLDNTSRAYIGRSTSQSCNNGIDSSANDSNNGNNDVVVDGHVMNACVQKGAWANYVNRVSFRNVRGYGGMSDCFIRERSYSGPGAGDHYAQNVDILGLSLNNLVGEFVQFTTSFWRTWTVKNCIVVKSGNGPFYEVLLQADLAQLTVANNCYYRNGGTDGQNNFATIAGVAKTWTEWKAIVTEANSMFADPLFAGSTDLSLNGSSPCIGKGAAIQAIKWDALGVQRGATFDIGAIAYQSSSGGGGGPGSSHTTLFEAQGVQISPSFNIPVSSGRLAISPSSFGI